MCAPYYPKFTREQDRALKGYRGILAFLDGAMPGRKGIAKDEKSIARNTIAFKVDDAVIIRLHRTNILRFLDRNRGILLNMGGWNSVTTRERMNRFLPGRWYVANLRGEAYVGYRGKTWDAPHKTFAYVNGMRLNQNGTVTYKPTELEVAV